MPYIGKSPVGGGFHKLDNLTASATATYALTLGGAAYYPETANQLLVSLNGVIQAPQDSFTVSGSNLIFDSALTVTDSIDFVVALGDVLGVQGVTDGTVTTAKIANQAVTMDKLATSGTLPALDGSALTGIGGGAGSIAQVQYTQYDSTNTQSISANTDTSITNLSVNITPTATNSIIKLESFLFAEYGATNWTANTTLFFLRDSTKLSAPVAGNRRVGISFPSTGYHTADASFTPDSAHTVYFDGNHNTTSQITYHLAMSSIYASTLYVNRTVNDSNTNEHERGVSFISATEILQ